MVHANEKLAAFLELERITHELALSALVGHDSPSFEHLLSFIGADETDVA